MEAAPDADVAAASSSSLGSAASGSERPGTGEADLTRFDTTDDDFRDAAEREAARDADDAGPRTFAERLRAGVAAVREGGKEGVTLATKKAKIKLAKRRGNVALAAMLDGDEDWRANVLIDEGESVAQKIKDLSELKRPRAPFDIFRATTIRKLHSRHPTAEYPMLKKMADDMWAVLYDHEKEVYQTQSDAETKEYNETLEQREILEYARDVLGIRDPRFLWIAEQAWRAPLPSENWIICKDNMDDQERVYYYNTETEESQWEHPLDNFYRQQHMDERKKVHMLVTKVQARWKGVLWRRRKEIAENNYRMAFAVVRIQTNYRGKRTRRRFKSSILIQRHMRGWIVRLRANRERENWAATVFQRGYHRYMAMKRLRILLAAKRIKDAEDLEQQMLDDRELYLLTIITTRIQRAYRSKLHMRNLEHRMIVKLQATYRGRECRRQILAAMTEAQQHAEAHAKKLKAAAGAPPQKSKVKLFINDFGEVVSNRDQMRRSIAVKKKKAALAVADLEGRKSRKQAAEDKKAAIKAANEQMFQKAQDEKLARKAARAAAKEEAKVAAIAPEQREAYAAEKVVQKAEADKNAEAKELQDEEERVGLEELKKDMAKDIIKFTIYARKIQIAFRYKRALRIHATHMQAVWRGKQGRRLVQVVREERAAKLIQRIFHGWQAREFVADVEEATWAAVTIQAHWRRYEAEEIVDYLRVQRAAAVVQKHFRGHRERHNIAILHIYRAAAVDIQAAWRGHHDRMKASWLLWMSIWTSEFTHAEMAGVFRIQAEWRAYRWRRKCLAVLERKRLEMAAYTVQRVFRTFLRRKAAERKALERERAWASYKDVQTRAATQSVYLKMRERAERAEASRLDGSNAAVTRDSHHVRGGRKGGGGGGLPSGQWPSGRAGGQENVPGTPNGFVPMPVDVLMRTATQSGFKLPPLQRDGVMRTGKVRSPKADADALAQRMRSPMDQKSPQGQHTGLGLLAAYPEFSLAYREQTPDELISDGATSRGSSTPELGAAQLSHGNVGDGFNPSADPYFDELRSSFDVATILKKRARLKGILHTN